MYTNARFEVVATDSGEIVLMVKGAGDNGEEARIVARFDATAFPGTLEQLRENAERLAACWNLCLGIPAKVLDDCAVKANLIARIDALFAAIRRQDIGLSRLPGAHGGPSNWHG